jgi:hypothetical protein
MLLEQRPCLLLLLLLLLLLQAPPDFPASSSWQQYLQSPGWQHELAVSGDVAPGFQIQATDAAAAALWAVVRHWHSPADALVAGVHYGGDTDTIACMAGERARWDSSSSSSIGKCSCSMPDEQGAPSCT